MEDNGGALSVVDVRIHKVNGVERYTYDANDNRIPVAKEGMMMKGDEGSMMMNETMQEDDK